MSEIISILASGIESDTVRSHFEHKAHSDFNLASENLQNIVANSDSKALGEQIQILGSILRYERPGSRH